MRLAACVALLLSIATPARAEWQLKPFVGMKFGGDTNLGGDLELAAGKKKPTVGISTVMLGEVLGAEIDLGWVPSFFEGNSSGVVIGSSVITLTGNVIVALPRRMSEYTLRPYFVGGAGFIRASTKTRVPEVLEISSSLPAVDFGGGVTGFLSRSVGVSWEVRRFNGFSGNTADTDDGLKRQLKFWRANMALAIRY